MSLEATGIAAAVETFMVRENDLACFCKEGDALDDVESDLNVPLHYSPFIGGQGPRLKENTVRDSEFPNVVQIGSSRDTQELFVRQPHTPANFEGIA